MRCPRCVEDGVVYKATVRDLGTDVYVCGHCEALWTHPQSIGPSASIPLALFLSANGVQGGRAALTGEDANWDGSRTVDTARAAVAADPADLSTRLRLVTILLDAGQPAEALEHCAVALAQDPANLQALYGAAQAASALGDTTREQGYRRLLRALSGAEPAPSQSPDTDEGGDQNIQDGGGIPRSERAVSANGRGEEPLRIGDGDEEESADWLAECPQITLADVAGMETVKRRLQVAFLAPLRNPDLRKAYGKSLRGGLLLFGPPGCGKTFIARATAGELAATFIPVGLSDVLDMWLGQSEHRLHEIFETARRQAPAVLFFDELDALGQKRSHLKHHAGRNVVNQLLSELDGIGHDNDGVFVLGATNHPWDVDTALLRPGRFDRSVLVLPPDEAARTAIVRAHLHERPTDRIDAVWLAAQTKDFSGADVAHLCDSATELALEESVVSGSIRPIGMADFKRALKEVRPSTRPWFETARHYAMFANEDGMYDELAAYMRARKIL